MNNNFHNRKVRRVSNKNEINKETYNSSNKGSNEIKKQSWDKKRLIIESAVAIFCVILGNMLGKNSNIYYYNGQKLSESELNLIIQENTDLKINNNELSAKIKELAIINENYEKENIELSFNNENINQELSQIPSIEFENYGLTINGEEKTINKNKSLVILDGAYYYSKDIVNALLPSNSDINVKNDNIYIGRIIEDKKSLFTQTIMEQKECKMIDSSIDSYGNIYSNVLLLDTYWKGEKYIIYVLNNKYSLMKFSAAIEDRANMDKKGIISIKADDQIVYTSDILNKKTEPFTVSDIPINNCMLLTIEYNNEGYNNCLVTDAVVYN